MLRLVTLFSLAGVTALAAQVPARATPVTPVVPAAPAIPAVPFRAYTDYSSDINSAYTALDMAQSNLNSVNFDYGQTLESLDNFRFAQLDDQLGSFASAGGWGGPTLWAPGDPADSLYRSARELLNRGDYRRAADEFKSVPVKFPSSVYVPDAQYWEAFSLYRIGGTPELQEALKVLQERKPTARDSMMKARETRVAPRTDRPATVKTETGTARASGSSSSAASADARAQQAQVDAAQRQVDAVQRQVDVVQNQADLAQRQADAIDRENEAMARQNARVVTNSYDVSRGNFSYSYSTDGGVDAAGLAARIASVLSSRGMANDPAVKQALAAGGNACDTEDQSVKAEALNALMESDADAARDMATKILARRDKCSAPLRRNAVMLLGNRHGDAATPTLVGVAKNDPEPTVRSAAMDWLIRAKSEAALAAVIDIAHSDTSEQMQRVAVSALTRSDDPRAKAELRAIAENNSAREQLRLTALQSFDRDRGTTADGAWLRDLYGKTTSTIMKEQIVSTLGQIGGDANNQWLVTLIHDENQPLEMRASALRRMGRTMDIASLGKAYDGASERPIRETIIQLLSDRKEPEAADKLIEIAKNGTDPQMRREAISALARSKDPRASKLLLELIDR